MKVFENGIYRDATPEEVEAWHNTPKPENEKGHIESDLADKAEAYDILMGVSE